MTELYFGLVVFSALLVVVLFVIVRNEVRRSIKEVRQILEVANRTIKKKTMSTVWGITVN